MHSVARATSHIRKTAQGCTTKRQDVRGQGDTGSQATTISVLPDNVLLEIFCFYKDDHHQTYPGWGWRLLVHVCRRWRQVVFASPLRLELVIVCTSMTPVRKNLGIWPALPICIYSGYYSNHRVGDNIVATLEYADRVCEVRLIVTRSELEMFSTVMQEPLPVLTSLHISSFKDRGIAPALPVEFLGGSAPRLRTIYLNGIPFPALPTLLLSTTDLVDLDLRDIPRTGYISPEAMVVGLAALPRLRTFRLTFQLATPCPDRIYPPPVTRTVLPALTTFHFQGVCKYLEVLVSRIDAPRLDRLSVFYDSYLDQLVDFQVAQLAIFIDRLVDPKLTPFKYARVAFHNHKVAFHMYSHANESFLGQHYARTEVLCHRIDWQVSHIAHVVSHFSATLSNVVHLKLADGDCIHMEGIDGVEWLNLFHQFPTVQTLHVSHQLAGHVALALEEIAWDSVAEVLPSLVVIHLAGLPAPSIEKFVAARQLSGRPVTVIETEEELYERVESHVSE